MRVVQMNRFGGPEVLEVVERSTPKRGRGEVLVRSHAAGTYPLERAAEAHRALEGRHTTSRRGARAVN